MKLFDGCVLLFASRKFTIRFLQYPKLTPVLHVTLPLFLKLTPGRPFIEKYQLFEENVIILSEAFFLAFYHQARKNVKIFCWF